MLRIRGRRGSRQGRALADLWEHHPRIELALRTSVAALVAWRVAHWLPGPAEQYPYYAPLGAVLGTYPTVAGSTRESLRSVLGILLGAVIGVAVGLLALPSGLAVALAVLAGVLVAGLPWLGEHRSWVPTAALFVLVLGGSGTEPGQPLDFAVAYAGLTFVGAAIAVLLNFLVPSLRRAGSVRSLGEVSEALADQVDDLAKALDRDVAPTAQEWRARRHDLRPELERMRAALALTQEAQRANLRQRRADPRASRRLLEQGRVLQRVALMLEDLTDLFAEEERGDREEVPLGRTLRPPTVTALRRLAAVLRSGPDAALDESVRAEAESAVERLWEELAAATFPTHVDRSVAGAVVIALNRCLRALAGSAS